MIARVWKARLRAGNLDAYRSHLQQHVIPQLRSIRGFCGITLLAGDEGHIMVETRWQSMASNTAAY